MSAAETSENDRYTGMLLGIAVGDALGLPAEGLSPEEIRRRWNCQWKMRLCCNRGMVSDDTEHALMTAECLAPKPDTAENFQSALAWKLRWWFLAVPPAIGLATTRACIKLLCGWPTRSCGVRSAGNGPLIRALVIGAFFADDKKTRQEFTMASTRLTHTDHRAEIASLAIAEVAAYAARGEPSEQVLPALVALSEEPEWTSTVYAIVESRRDLTPTREFIVKRGLGRGVTGYCYYTALATIYAWLVDSKNFSKSLEEILNCGGDTDSTGAIVGGLLGLSCGPKQIPNTWVSAICDWPNGVRRIKAVSHTLSSGVASQRRFYFWFAQFPRNLLFLLIVLLHGFYRLGRKCVGLR